MDTSSLNTSTNGTMSEFDDLLHLPRAGEFLLLRPRPCCEGGVRDVEQNASDSSSPSTVLFSATGTHQLPKVVSGVPVFVLPDGEEVVFVAHLLTRILSCQCRVSRHFGLFKDRVFSQYRRTVETSRWKTRVHQSPAYAPYAARFPLNRFKESSAAITLSGLCHWISSGKCEAFKNKEDEKCQQSCLAGKCTCNSNK